MFKPLLCFLGLKISFSFSNYYFPTKPFHSFPTLQTGTTTFSGLGACLVVSSEWVGGPAGRHAVAPGPLDPANLPFVWAAASRLGSLWSLFLLGSKWKVIGRSLEGHVQLETFGGPCPCRAPFSFPSNPRRSQKTSWHQSVYLESRAEGAPWKSEPWNQWNRFRGRLPSLCKGHLGHLFNLGHLSND